MQIEFRDPRRIEFSERLTNAGLQQRIHQPEDAVSESMCDSINTFAGGLLLIDDHRRVMIANDPLCKALGKTDKEIVGKSIDKLDFEIADDSTTWPWEESLQTGQSVSERLLRIQQKIPEGDRSVNVTVNCRAFDRQGALLTFDDITELKETQVEFASGHAEDRDTELAQNILAQLIEIRSGTVDTCGTPGLFESLLVEQPPNAPADLSEQATHTTGKQTPSVDDKNRSVASAIHCTLPLDDDDYREIVIDFVQRLDIKLMGMLSMLKSQLLEELGNEGHWLKGVGGTAGYPAFTDPATELMRAGKQADLERCKSAMHAVLCVRDRLVVPTQTGSAKASAAEQSTSS